MDRMTELPLDKTTVDFLDYYLKSPERPVSFSVSQGIRNVVKFYFSPNQAFYAKLLVIFDELFRGTNVKDAYDGSLRIIQALSGLNNGFFMVSTHIVEVAQALAAHAKISFNYLRINMDGERPVFDYQLRGGITDDRIGLWILQNEGVFELLAVKNSETGSDEINP